MKQTSSPVVSQPLSSAFLLLLLSKLPFYPNLRLLIFSLFPVELFRKRSDISYCKSLKCNPRPAAWLTHNNTPIDQTFSGSISGSSAGYLFSGKLFHTDGRTDWIFHTLYSCSILCCLRRKHPHATENRSGRTSNFMRVLHVVQINPPIQDKGFLVPSGG